jgi:thiol-disulfide isomerase/thioredoxin
VSNKNLLIMAIWLFLLAQGQAVAQCCPIPSPQSAPIQGVAATFDPARYKGQVLVVNFMAAWCPSCYAEIPGFVKLYPKLQGKGVVFVAIAVQTTREETEALVRRFSIPYPIYLDPSGGVAVDRYRLQAMPTTLIFDKQGRKVKELRGEVSAEALWAHLEGLL